MVNKKPVSGERVGFVMGLTIMFMCWVYDLIIIYAILRPTAQATLYRIVLWLPIVALLLSLLLTKKLAKAVRSVKG